MPFLESGIAQEDTFESTRRKLFETWKHVVNKTYTTKNPRRNVKERGIWKQDGERDFMIQRCKLFMYLELEMTVSSCWT